MLLIKKIGSKETHWSNKKSCIAQISEKGYEFFFGEMYFTGDDCYQKLLVFALMLSSVLLDSNNKVLLDIDSSFIWKIKQFDSNLKPAMSNLPDVIIILKFNNSVLVQIFFLRYILILF